jgi:hypothetical protein
MKPAAGRHDDLGLVATMKCSPGYAPLHLVTQMEFFKILRQIGAALADIFHESEYTYRPKRGQTSRASGWCERLLQYRWGTGDGPFADWDRIQHLETILGQATAELADGRNWSSSEEQVVQEATRELFKWGGVLRGRGHNPPDVGMIKAVMLTAANYDNSFNAPMDSAWTKLAALSTASSENANQPPQVIFDSRVSIALLEKIDAACTTSALPPSCKANLQSCGLGFVTGRGGNRQSRTEKLYKLGWKNRYMRWDCQFTASRVVAAICKALNENSEKFGAMPLPGGEHGKWTTRGVEMVLFMDGY